jgi:hypothetical protein
MEQESYKAMEQESYKAKVSELEFELVRQHRLITSIMKRCLDQENAITELRDLFITIGEEVQALKLQPAKGLTNGT